MSLVILFFVEIVLWIVTNRNTPFSTPRLTILRDVTGFAAFLGGLYATLSYVFMPVTLLDPFHALLFSLGNAVPWVVLAVRQHSVAYRH